ncbi:S8 family serine peptidase [Arthrobacter sp. FW306-2-2C-D06B]|uniref:S8 family serine peptidase n=1 Tax=Arthrobacter sp. FW306-2-2C-D06B TaxID=2879618 RepID=UPI001F023C37|nr:S8 family serine peptidase [Arthrobacter sp. FW306-2-2C-D06B]UKA57137.1 S8 family serine peptidase [Arthrobacter sp. FW306-2-2C-D06B]
MAFSGVSAGTASPIPSNLASSAKDDGHSRYIVKYAAGTDAAAGAQSLRSSNVTVARTFTNAMQGAVVTATPAQADELKRSGQVAAVEVDAPLKMSATEQGAPWGLDRIDQRTLPLSGTYTPIASGAGVVAYMIDSGVLASHTEFGGRVANGWTAIADGQGTNDCDGHGTHVAGIVAGQTYGVAKSATIVPVRVVDCTGSGYTSDLIAGLDWVAANHVAGTPAVANMSIGGPPSPMVDAAVQGLISKGITAVVAAGNATTDACNTSPARVLDALTVAASDSWDRQASFSNFGNCVDLYAPGVGITSAGIASNTATAVMSGTSMAAPHVTGAVAALLSLYPRLSPSAVGTLLLSEASSGVVSGSSPGTPNRLLFSAAPTPASVDAATAITTAAAASPSLGAAASVMVCGLRNDGCYEMYQGGAIVWSPATGAHVSIGGIRAAWAGTGYENGPLGYPTTNEVCGLRDSGCYQMYQGGAIVWSPATGAHVSIGGIRAAWAGTGYENGPLGYPTTNEVCGLRDSGCYQMYQGGAIVWSPATGAHVSIGGIRAAWAATGYENGPLGYPTTNEYPAGNGGVVQNYQGGRIAWSPTAGTTVTYG